MPLASWMDYERILSGMASGEWRVIGWGAGVNFSLAHAQSLLRHDYLVDSNPAKWGTRFHGFDVRPPDVILNEDPDKTIVIIYPFRSAGREILESLDRLGPFLAVPLFDPPVMRSLALRLKTGLDLKLQQKPKARSSQAILVQGPIVPGVTEWVLRYYASRYPHDWLVLSTWKDSPEGVLERLEPFCDRILRNSPPLSPGPGNRNLQIVSTRGGLETLAELGIGKTLKTRTDTLATAENMLGRSAELQASQGPGRCREMGLANRIVITERYTLRYLPYLVTDLLMYGDTDDLRRYWSVPLDSRNFRPRYADWMERSYLDVSRHRAMTEMYLSQNFLDSVGYPVSHTLEGYWGVLRDMFIVMDDRWFGHFYPHYDMMTMNNGYDVTLADATVDFNFWCHLQTADLAEEAREIDLSKIRWRHMWERRSLCDMSALD